MTDVGVIPEDWEVITLDILGKFSKGAGISKSEANSGTIKAIRYGELYTIHNYIIKKYESFISQEVANKSKKLIKGDIVFACSGETKEDIGKCAAFVDDCETYAGGDTIIFSPTIKTDSNYLGYILNSSSSMDQKSSSAQGDSVVHISVDSIRNIQIPLPDFLEQQAIADALTKVDNLITSLTKVIEKKKLIKKGAMQKLLSGEMRLDGYNNIIKSVNLSDIGEIKAGGTPSTNVPSYWGGTINWLQSGAVKNRVLDIRDVEKTITYDGLASSSAYLIKENSVLIAITGATCGNIAYLPFKSAANQSVVAIQVNVGFNSKYIFYMLIQNSDKIVNNRGGSAQGGVAVNILKEIELCIHEDIDEQTAIADILTTMDNEIEALEKERDKYKCIKQGMMQQLLTGKIRLTCQ